MLAELVLRNTATVFEGFGQQIDVLPVRLTHREDGAEIHGALWLGQYERVLARQLELRGRGFVGQVAVAGHRREPLACVALVNTRLHGKLAGGNWTRFCQRREQAESIADRRQCAHLLRGQVAEYFEGESLDDLHVQSCSRGGHRLTVTPNTG